MELIERYIHEVGTYLPREIRDDVTEELRSNLEEALQDRLRSGDWKSAEAAELALLEELGAPHQLADSYVPKPRVLFGPRLYPAFIRTMKIVVAVLIGLAVLGLLVDITDSTTWLSLVKGLVSAFRSVVTGSLVILGIVVVVFAIIERTAGAPTPTTEDWDPRSLPTVDDPDKVSIGDRVVSVVFLVVALVVLNLFRDRIGAYFSMNDERGWIPMLGPAFDAQLWLLNLCLVLDLVVNFLVLLRWRWSTALRWANFAINSLYVVWLWRIAFGPSILAVDPAWMVSHGWSAEAAADYYELVTDTLAGFVDFGVRLGFYVAAAALAYQFVKLLRRVFVGLSSVRADRF